MELFALLAMMGGAALGMIIIGTVLAALWCGGTESEPVLFRALLRRQGDHVALRAFECSTDELGAAMQRCRACHEAAQCPPGLRAARARATRLFARTPASSRA